uniref:IS200/IS605 family transposase n=1 Tax=Emticicia agri TaxID=2492393 RepID=UPI00286E57AF|nr:IS200/IS605 family transposase [Emticicia agri]
MNYVEFNILSLRDTENITQSFFYRYIVPTGLNRQNCNHFYNYGKYLYSNSFAYIFAVKYRDGVIQASWKNELYKYITGVIQERKHKLMIINGMPDHIHILIGMHPTQSISDLLQDIKGNSSTWINKKKLVKGKFEWQEGYGVFSYGKSQIKEVIKYIESQEEHHRQRTFREEYLAFLEKFEVEYDEKYIFKELI